MYRCIHYAYIFFIDSDPAEELPAAKASINKSTEVDAQPLDPPTSPQAAAADTPPPNQPSISHRKGGRPPNRKGKLGKNQYTKDRDLRDGDDQSPGRSQSRDVARGDDNGSKGATNEGKQGKSKGTANSRITMSDMKKRVAAILDFISRTQLEMARESASAGSEEAAEKLMLGFAETLPMIRVNGDRGSEKEGESGNTNQSKEFKDLSCLEMMDDLTRQLVKWQKEFT